jgi:hypothetical protein
LDLFYEMSQINAIVNEFGGALPAIYQTRPDLENTGKERNKLGKVKRRLPGGLTWDKPVLVLWFSETCLSVLDYVYKTFVSNGLYTLSKTPCQKTMSSDVSTYTLKSRTATVRRFGGMSGWTTSKSQSGSFETNMKEHHTPLQLCC